LAYQIVGDATLFDVVFTAQDVVDYRSWLTGDQAINAAFNAELREHGVFKSPGKLYPCLAVNEADLALTEQALAKAANRIKPG